MLSLTVRPRPSPRSSDIHQRWQDVRMSWCDCHDVMSSDHIEEAGLLSPTIVSDDSMISLFLFHHLLRSRHLTSVQSTLVSDLDPLLTGHSQAANCQPCVPVDLSTSPLSAQRLQFLILKNRCCFPRPQPWPAAQFSNQDRCPLYKLCPGWPCLPAGHQRNFTFLAQRSVKNVKSWSKNLSWSVAGDVLQGSAWSL